MNDAAARPARGRAARLARRRPALQARAAGPQTARNSHDATFSDAAAEWLRYVEFDRRRRPATVRDYRRMVDDVLAPLFGHLPLRAVSAELVDSLVGYGPECYAMGETYNEIVAIHRH